MTQNAVVLLSGGLDSTTVAAIALAQGFDVHAMSFSYGQRHAGELASACAVVKSMGIKNHIVVDIDLRVFGGSALTADIDVPRNSTIEAVTTIPITYVPARNTVFLSYALAWAEVLPSSDLFIGVNAVDYSGYPDCRPEFIKAFQSMANLATVIGIESSDKISIHTPLMEMTKAQIIKTGLELGVDYGLTTSCYDPEADGKPCMQCDACLLRCRGFRDAGVKDPQLKIFTS